MRPAIATLGVLVLGYGALGCGALRPGRFLEGSFEHEHLEYRIEGTSMGDFLAGWTLLNFQPGPDGSPGPSRVGPDWVYRPEVDLDGNGVVQAADPQPIYDLYFHSRRDGGVIWVRTLPLPPSRSETELRVLGTLFVNAVGQAGLERAAFDDAATLASADRAFATREIDTADRQVDGRPALQVDLEVVSAEELAHGQDARWHRARVVLVRTELPWSPWGGGGWSTRTTLWPVIMVVGYANLPDDFPAGLGSHEELLQRIRFRTPRTARMREGVLTCLEDRDGVRFITVRGASGVRVVASDAASELQRECVERAVGNAGYDVETGWRGFAVLEGGGAPAAVGGGDVGGEVEVDPETGEPVPATPASTEDLPEPELPPHTEIDPEAGAH
ncbi:MAG: hypothetical protein ACFCGT_17670 [Sandaracinaceae bacterium]